MTGAQKRYGNAGHKGIWGENMEMKKFIKCEYGEVFSSYRYLTVMYSYSREHGKFSDFELIKTIEN